MSPSAPPPRARRGVLIAILILAAGLRLSAWHFTPMMTNDGPDFLWQAERLRDGDLWAALSHPYHPLYGAAIAAVSFVTGEVASAAITVSIASALLIVLAVAALASRVFPGQPACAEAAALLAAVHARTQITTSDVLSDGLFLALFLASAAALLAGWDRGACRRTMLAAGVLAGLSYLARPEGLFLLAAAALWLAAGLRQRGTRAPRAAHVAATAVFVAGLMAVAAPYALAIHALTGHWTVSLKPSILATGLTSADAPPPPPPRDSPLGSPKVYRVRAAGVSAPATAPAAAPPVRRGSLAPSSGAPAGVDDEDGGGAAARRRPLLKSVVVFWTTLRSDTLLVVVLGLAALWQRRRGLCVVLLLLVAGWVAMGAVNVAVKHYLSARHMLAPSLLLLPLGGAGIVALWRAASGRPALQLLARGLVVLILFAHAGPGAKPRHVGNKPRLAALAWAAGHTAPQQRLGVHRKCDSFYSGRRVLQIELPCAEQTLLAAMREWDVPLLVLDESLVRLEHPGWLAGGPFEQRARFGEGEDAVIVLAATEPPG